MCQNRPVARGLVTDLIIIFKYNKHNHNDNSNVQW